MPSSPHSAPSVTLAVVILAFPQAQLLDVAGPLQVFATANDLAASAGEGRPYEPRVVSAGGATLSCSAGLTVGTHALPGPEAAIDTVIVAGGSGVHAAASDPALLAWIRECPARARRTASVCTGAFLLGAAGLLDGKRVVTHWLYCDELARRFPAACVEPDPIFIRDGALWTSAGVTAGIDLALALVEADLGRALALDVARHLVVFLKRPGGQSQFSAALVLQHGAPRFEQLHAWMAAHLGGDLSLPALADRAGMSERSFVRRYREATGRTPARAVEMMRVEAARHLLGSTAQPVKRVAARCGFGSEETMRRGFLRVLGATPQAYRERFADTPPA